MATDLSMHQRRISLVFLALLFLVLVTLSPLSARPNVKVLGDGSGNPLRQITFLAVFIALLTSLSREQIAHAVRTFPKTLMLLLVWAALSVIWSIAPDITIRRLALTTIIIFSLWGCVANLPPEEVFRRLLLALAIVVLADILSTFIVPDLAIHQNSDSEQTVAGEWRGIHFHKNMAGAVAAISLICWGWNFIRTKSVLSFVVLLLSIYLLIMSGAKTSMFLGPFSFISCVFYIQVCRTLGSVTGYVLISFFAALLAGFLLLAVGTHKGNELLVQLSGVDFTGRASIWAYLLTYIQAHPIFGSGYGAFWGIGELSPVLSLPNSWLHGVAHSHNGYIEILITLGVPGLLFLLVFILRFAIFTPNKSDFSNEILGVVWVNITIFGILHNMLEVSFLDRDRIVWVFLLIGIFSRIKSSRNR